MATNPKNVSRADQVRARRKIEPIQRKPIPRSENRVSRDASNASRVISRHSTYRPGSSNTYSTRKRKPVYLSTSTPGSEIRLPSLPQFSFSWRALSGLLVGVALVLIYMMLNSNTFTVNTVNLSGGVRVPSEEIKICPECNRRIDYLCSTVPGGRADSGDFPGYQKRTCFRGDARQPQSCG